MKPTRQAHDWDIYYAPETPAPCARTSPRPPRGRLTRPALILGIAVLAFWLAAAFVISAL